jgi:hypothetical protein
MSCATSAVLSDYVRWRNMLDEKMLITEGIDKIVNTGIL